IADRDDVRRLRDVGSAVGLLTAADLGEDPPPPGVAGTFEPVDEVVGDGPVLPALRDAAERVAAGNVDPDARGARFEGLRPRARVRHVDHPVGGIVEGAAARRYEPADEAAAEAPERPLVEEAGLGGPAVQVKRPLGLRPEAMIGDDDDLVSGPAAATRFPSASSRAT